MSNSKKIYKIGLVNIAEYSDISNWSSYKKDFEFLNKYSIPFKDFASGRLTPGSLIDGFYEAVEDPEVSIIWFTNGGNRFIESLDNLDWDKIKKNNKVFIGLSDFTHFSILANQNNIRTYYGLALKKISEFYSNSEQQKIASALIHLIDNCNDSSFDGGLIHRSTISAITGGNLCVSIFMIGSFNIDIRNKTLFIEHHYIPGESIDDLIYFIHQLSILLIKSKNIPKNFLLGHSMLFENQEIIDFSLINRSIERVLKKYFVDTEVKTIDHFKYIIEMK